MHSVYIKCLCACICYIILNSSAHACLFLCMAILWIAEPMFVCTHECLLFRCTCMNLHALVCTCMWLCVNFVHVCLRTCLYLGGKETLINNFSKEVIVISYCLKCPKWCSEQGNSNSVREIFFSVLNCSKCFMCPTNKASKDFSYQRINAAVREC